MNSEDSIQFVTKYSNNAYNIKLGKTLLNFMEFDFQLFYDQAVNFSKQMQKLKNFDKASAKNAKNFILKCHPYIEALAVHNYNDVVIDCMINDICLAENVSTNALWERFISPKNNYEKAMFKRLSEYRNNKGCNEWVNILVAQNYVKSKVEFIFDGDAISKAEGKIRAKYFDLAYSVVATETGVPIEANASCEEISVSQMPNAVFMISKTSKELYKTLEESIKNSKVIPKTTVNKNNRDSYAFNPLKIVRDLPRPTEIEMMSAIENFGKFPDVVYLPNCFKAIIDLEIMKMLDNNIMLLKCERCGRYYLRDKDATVRVCNRVTPRGKTCLEEYNAQKAAEVMGGDVNARSEKIYEKLLSKLGKEISKYEIDEWVLYLERLISNMEKGVSSAKDVTDFLSQTEKMYKLN